MLTPSLRRTLAVAAAVFAIDRASKIWIVEGLGLAEKGRIAAFDPWLNLTMAWNRGVNFGLLDFGDGGRFWLIGLAVAIVVGLAAWAWRERGWPAAVGAGAVIGGALGNVWDRLQWGAVADFLNVSCCGIDNPFAFNVADAAIFVGVVILILFPGEGASRREGA
ncbi:signal peptidase II [Amaricoccus sp.]|uniref:signal peptidase II n=1 Tax=Amaricoccus sp. TaxID=1872485 RepID=UPI001B59767B|nr:signal peptidase II [Amaricoccus sp.]MBP7243251.1 signal peptidase II [Amaricoccus sp.]